ncbi:hypothetical protein ACFX1Z_007060 [Malus domestica]
MHNDVVRLKKLVSRLKSKEIELQGALSASENLKNELDELQNARTDLIEKNKQLRSGKSSLEVVLTQGQADFYKLGYIDYFLGMPSDYTFSYKDLELFAISF